MERLETRQLMAANILDGSASGWVAIIGDNQPDEVVVEESGDLLTVKVSASARETSKSFQKDEISKIYFFGGNGNNVFINRTDVPSRVYTGNGVDIVSSGNADDVVQTGEGDDFVFSGDGVDAVYGQGGHDILVGGDDDDFLAGGDGNDLLFGADGDDYLDGGEGHDWLFGQSGADYLYGRSGNDGLAGGDGDDTLYGHAGHDAIFGNAGDDFLSGAEGLDVLDGGEGADDLLGGVGDDRIAFDWDDLYAMYTGRGVIDAGGGQYLYNVSAAELQDALTVQDSYRSLDRSAFSALHSEKPLEDGDAVSNQIINPRLDALPGVSTVGTSVLGDTLDWLRSRNAG